MYDYPSKFITEGDSESGGILFYTIYANHNISRYNVTLDIIKRNNISIGVMI